MTGICDTATSSVAELFTMKEKQMDRGMLKTRKKTRGMVLSSGIKQCVLVNVEEKALHL